jgi:hypothetical protein
MFPAKIDAILSVIAIRNFELIIEERQASTKGEIAK